MKTWWFSRHGDCRTFKMCRLSRSLYDWHFVPTRFGMTSWPVIWWDSSGHHDALVSGFGEKSHHGNVSSRVKWTSKSLDQFAGYSSCIYISKMQPVRRAWRLGMTTTCKFWGPQSSCWAVSRTGSWRSLVKRCCDLFVQWRFHEARLILPLPVMILHLLLGCVLQLPHLVVERHGIGGRFESDDSSHWEMDWLSCTRHHGRNLTLFLHISN